MKKIYKKLNLLAIVLVFSGMLFFPTSTFAQFKSVNSMKDDIISLIETFNSSQGLVGLMSGSTSSSYIGNFPHFSVGAITGVSVSGIGLLEVMKADYSNFSTLDSFPAVNAALGGSFRVGGINIGRFKMPFDIGFRVSYLSLDTNSLNNLEDSSAFKLESFLIGFDMRIPIYEEQRLIPGLTVGIGYAYNGIGLSTPLNFNSLLNNKNLQVKDVNVKIGDADFSIDVGSHAASIMFQTSKNILFFEPYFGLEPYMMFGGATLKVSNADLQVDNNTGGGYKNYKEYLQTNSPIADDVLDFEEDGFSYQQNTTLGGLRIYGGFALHMRRFYLVDWAYSYEPFSNSWGISVGTRFEF